MASHYTQIEAYLDPKRPLKYQENFLISYLKPLLTSLSTGNVLDIGCGDGLLLYSLSRSFPNLNFLGIDSSQELIQIADSRDLPHNISYRESDALAISSDTKYDIIIASGVLSVFSNWIQVLDYWISLLKPSNSRIVLFGGFNPDNIEVKVNFRNFTTEPNPSWEDGLHVIPNAHLSDFASNRSLIHYPGPEFTPPIDIQPSLNAIRGYTLKLDNGDRVVVNGALQLRRFFIHMLSN